MEIRSHENFGDNLREATAKGKKKKKKKKDGVDRLFTSTGQF